VVYTAGERTFWQGRIQRKNEGIREMKGIIAVGLASIAYGIMPVFTKDLILQGMPTISVVFYRFLLAHLAIGVYLLASKKGLRVTKHQLKDLVFLGVAGFGLTAFFLASSYETLPVGLATMFHFTYPIFVVLMMMGVFHEKASGMKWLAVISAVIGLVFLMDLSGGLSVKGIVWAVLSGITYAVYVIGNRETSLRELPAPQILFYVTLVSVFFFGLQAVWKGELVVPSGARAWGDLFFISQVSTVFALLLLTYGIKTIGATKASMINMLEPVVGMVSGMVVYGERLDFRSGLGCMAIFLAVVCIAFDGAAEKKQVLKIKKSMG
jgi:drug/metabolite transporter (DMT)-like permease